MAFQFSGAFDPMLDIDFLKKKKKFFLLQWLREETPWRYTARPALFPLN